MVRVGPWEQTHSLVSLVSLEWPEYNGWDEKKEYDISKRLQNAPAVAMDKLKHLIWILHYFFTIKSPLGQKGSFKLRTNHSHIQGAKLNKNPLHMKIKIPAITLTIAIYTVGLYYT